MTKSTPNRHPVDEHAPTMGAPLATHDRRLFARARTLALVAGAALGVGGACGTEPGDSPDLAEVDENQQAVFSGTVVPSTDTRASALVSFGDLECSGVLLSDRWVLSAGHCVPNTNPGGIRVSRQGRTATGTFARSWNFPAANPFIDFGIVRVDPPFPNTPPRRLWHGSNADLKGKVIAVHGFGSVPCGSVAAPTKGIFTIESLVGNGYMVRMNANRQIQVGGDSGGPGFLTVNGLDYITGVTSAAPRCVSAPSTGSTATQVSTPFVRKLIDQAMFSNGVDLGGGIATAPVVAEVVQGHLDAFAFGFDGWVWTRNKNLSTGSWSEWNSAFGPPPGGATSDPAAVVRSGELYLFVRGANNATWYKKRDVSGGWGDWLSIGGNATSGPGVTVRSDGTIDVFVRGQDGAIYRQTGPNWTGFNRRMSSPAAGSSTSAPTPVLVRSSVERIWLLVRGADDKVYYRRWSANSEWDSWTSVGGSTRHAVAAVSTGDNRLDVFAVGLNQKIWHKVYDGAFWSQPNNESESWIEVPSSLATSSKPSVWSPAGRAPQIEVVARTTSNALWGQTYAY